MKTYKRLRRTQIMKEIPISSQIEAMTDQLIAITNALNSNNIKVVNAEKFDQISNLISRIKDENPKVFEADDGSSD